MDAALTWLCSVRDLQLSLYAYMRHGELRLHVATIG